MTAAEKLLWGTSWPIEATLLDGDLTPVTGVAGSTCISIRRKSNDQYFNFSTLAFGAWVGTNNEAILTEVDASNAPGEYKYDWDTSTVTNETDDDLYVFRIHETGSLARNVPQLGEIQADSWWKDIKDKTDQMNFTSGNIDANTVSSIAVTLTSGTIGLVSASVWDAQRVDHELSGSFGEGINLISSSISDVNGSLNLVSGAIDTVFDMTAGRWLINTSSNQMIFYKADNVTEVARFDLFGSDGSSSSDCVFERVKV